MRGVSREFIEDCVRAIFLKSTLMNQVIHHNATAKKRWRRPILIGSATTLVLLSAVAAFLFYAPRAALPSEPVEVFTLEIGGYPRTYTVFAPVNLQPGASVVFALHASQSRGEEMRRIVGGVLEPLAEKDNAVIVYPDGFEGHFNDARRAASYSARKLNIDDVAFAQGIIQQLVTDKQINPQQVYAIGYSNGAHMALRLALEVPETIKGVAAIAANLPAPENLDCKIAATPARFIVFVEGTQDPINPYEGGRVTLFGFGNRGKVLSAQASAEWFAQKLGLGGVESGTCELLPGLPVRQQDWQSASGHVRLVTIEGGGHTVPQAAYRFARIFGSTLPSNAVLESIWELFKETRK